MTQNETFNSMLTGGHPNSLGRTIEVVDLVLADSSKLEALYQCYFDADEVVRLRTSSAMKRLWRQHPDWIVPYIDRFLSEISQINQASTQWTFAQLCLELDSYLTAVQRDQAITLLKRNLTISHDWIVIINTLQTLSHWSHSNADLKTWLKPQLAHFANDKRKSVARNAEKLLASIR